jgi:hypothetical protein
MDGLGTDPQPSGRAWMPPRGLCNTAKVAANAAPISGCPPRHKASTPAQRLAKHRLALSSLEHVLVFLALVTCLIPLASYTKLPFFQPTINGYAVNPHPCSMARVYADVNANMPRSYWDYDSVNISWGVLENYEVVRKIGESARPC